MTTHPAEHCGPACTEAHTYRLGECALSSTPVTPFIPPAAEGLPDGLLASATAGAAMLDASAHTPAARNLLAHALVQLARDGWIRPAPGAGFDPARPERQPLPQPEPAPLECVCGAPVDWLFAAKGSGWIHRPGTPSACAHPRPRCPECQMPHALLPDEPPMCRSIRRRENLAATEATERPAIDEQPAPTGGYFLYTAPDGGRLHATPARRHGHPTVRLRTLPAHGRPAAAADIPADQLEDVIAGLRDIRRQACTDPEPDGVRVTYRASVPRHLLGAAVAEASAAIHAARTGR